LRQAKIKKKKVDEFPKDSLGIYDLTSNVFEKIPNVISYSLPKKSGKWVAYLATPLQADSSIKNTNIDSVHHADDSLKSSLPIIIEQTPNKKQKRKMSATGERLDEQMEQLDAATEEPNVPVIKEGNLLTVRNLSTHHEKKFPLINEYLWSENGKLIVLKSSAKKSDKTIQIWAKYSIQCAGTSQYSVLHEYKTAASNVIPILKAIIRNLGLSIVIIFELIKIQPSIKVNINEPQKSNI
jgi:hypothetical protein